MRPAETADPPITSAPTILTACPTGLGSRITGFFQDFVYNTHYHCFYKSGKRSTSLAAAILISKAGGIISDDR